MPALPHYVDAHRAATFDVRLPGSPPARTVLAFGPEPADHPTRRRATSRLPQLAGPATYLLITYGRSGPLIPALTDKIAAAGRNPGWT
jgi:hypothetical protein